MTIEQISSIATVFILACGGPTPSSSESALAARGTEREAEVAPAMSAEAARLDAPVMLRISEDEDPVPFEILTNGRSYTPSGQTDLTIARLPRPPGDLGGQIEALYPLEARRAGIEGEARVRVRVHVDGSVALLRVAGTSEAFAAACCQLLHGSHWTPAEDEGGAARETDVTYVCAFRPGDGLPHPD